MKIGTLLKKLFEWRQRPSHGRMRWHGAACGTRGRPLVAPSGTRPAPTHLPPSNLTTLARYLATANYHLHKGMMG